MNTFSEIILTNTGLENIFAEGVALGAVITAAVVFYILVIIANWKIFKKAGEKGWKSIIPIYNVYIIFKLFWKTGFFWATILTPIIYSIVTVFTRNSVSITLFLSTIVFVFLIVIGVILSDRVSRSFGHGLGYTIGLILFPNIFSIILGFNKDKYKKLKDK